MLNITPNATESVKPRSAGRHLSHPDPRAMMFASFVILNKKASIPQFEGLFA